MTGSFTAGEAARRPGRRDGRLLVPRARAASFIKPDVTAPGVQILAGASPTPPTPDPVDGGSPPGEYFQAIAGTSMSSPHVAGAAILLAAVHPDWTPGQIRSALMTTATTDVVKEDTATPADPFDMGAGRIDLGTAISAPLTFDETPANFVALGNDPVNAVHLNIPSINAPVMPGRLVTTRAVDERQRQSAGAATSATAAPAAPRSRSRRSEASRWRRASPRRSRSPSSRQRRSATSSSAPCDITRAGSAAAPAGRVRPHPGRRRPDPGVHPDDRREGRGDQTECTVQATNNSFDEQVVDLDSTTPANMQVVSGSAAEPRRSVHTRRCTPRSTLAGAAPGVPVGRSGRPGSATSPLEQLRHPGRPRSATRRSSTSTSPTVRVRRPVLGPRSGSTPTAT